MGLANSVTVEYPRKTIEVEVTGYLSLLPKDIWRYCISPYLQIPEDLTQWGPYFREPILRQRIQLSTAPDHREFWLNRHGQLFYNSRIYNLMLLDPQTNQNRSYHPRCRAMEYDYSTDTLYLQSDVVRADEAELAHLRITEASTEDKQIEGILPRRVSLLPTGYAPRLIPHEILIGPITLRVQGGTYTFLESARVIRQGTLREIPPTHTVQHLLYYGGYLIVVIYHNQDKTFNQPGEVLLYQIL